MTEKQPFVSVLIPAYNARFFPAALESALAQDYRNLEIIVCDDSMGDAIEASTRRVQDGRLRYLRNSSNLGFAGNFSHCLALARGEYIKFLNDDDLLHPACVRRMVAGFQQFGARVALVASRRRPVDAEGRPLPDFVETTPLAPQDALFDGKRLGNRLLVESLNRIGEPSTVVFRKADVEIKDGNLFRFGAHDYHCLADLSLWLRLLAKGDLLYLAAELSRFRVHAGQEQKKPDVAVRCITERAWIAADAMPLGFLADEELRRRALATAIRHVEHALNNDRHLSAANRDELTLAHVQLKKS